MNGCFNAILIYGFTEKNPTKFIDANVCKEHGVKQYTTYTTNFYGMQGAYGVPSDPDYMLDPDRAVEYFYDKVTKLYPDRFTKLNKFSVINGDYKLYKNATYNPFTDLIKDDDFAYNYDSDVEIHEDYQPIKVLEECLEVPSIPSVPSVPVEGYFTDEYDEDEATYEMDEIESENNTDDELQIIEKPVLTEEEKEKEFYDKFSSIMY